MNKLMQMHEKDEYGRRRRQTREHEKQEEEGEYSFTYLLKQTLLEQRKSQTLS